MIRLASGGLEDHGQWLAVAHLPALDRELKRTRQSG